MRRIVTDKETDAPISIHDVDAREAIFAKQNGRFVGIVIEENKEWVLRLGGSSASTGYHETFEKCIADALPRGFTFYVDRG